MIIRYCDKCKREIDKYEDAGKVTYFTRTYDIDLCLDCAEKWQEFRKAVQKKYEKLYEELGQQELKEIRDYLGIKEDEPLPRLVELEDD